MTNFPNVIFGPPFSAPVVGTFGTDFIFGGPGNDSLTGLAGTDVLDGGPGNNTVNYQLEEFFGGRHGASVNLATGSAIDTFGFPDALANIQNINGTDFPDAVVGNAADNVIQGNGGSDYIAGGLGNDVLFGGVGSDAFDLRGDVQAGATDVIGDFNIGGFPDSILLPTSVQGSTAFGDSNGVAFASVNLGLGNTYTLLVPGATGAQVHAQTFFA